MANDFVALWLDSGRLLGGDINLRENNSKPASLIQQVVFLSPEDPRDIFRLSRDQLSVLYQQSLYPLKQSTLTRFIKHNAFTSIYQHHVCLGNRTSPEKWIALLNSFLNYQDPKSVGIIGLGTIGQDVANLLINESYINRLNLFTPNQKKLRGIVLDLQSANHLIPIEPHKNCKGVFKSSDVVIVCFNQQAPKSPRLTNERFAKVANHLSIIHDLATQAVKVKFRGKIVIVTNPVDVLSSAFGVFSQDRLFSHPIIGIGLGLDYNRLKCITKKKIDVIGEHGDNLLLVQNKDGLLTISKSDTVLSKVKEYSSEIRKYTDRTRFGPSHEIRSIIRSLAQNDQKINRVSMLSPSGHLGSHVIFYRGIPEFVYRLSVNVRDQLAKINTEHQKYISDFSSPHQL